MFTQVAAFREAAAVGEEATASPPVSSFSSKVEALLERIEYRRCESGEDLEDIYRLRYKAYKLHGFIEESSNQMVTDDLDDAPNCYRFGVFIDGELVSTVRIHHISEAEPYGPVMKTFDDILRPRLLRGESFINPTMLAAEPYYRSPLQALPYLTLRLGLVASVYFDATSCIGVVREEHTAFYRRIFGAVPVGEARAYPPISVPVILYDANCAANRQPILKRFPFFKSTPVEQRMLFAKPAKGELAPLTILPTAKYYRDAA
ncbi:hypothetical protein [Mesorhizobium sp. KR9-304]|uniref:N-acyl amino acid synthase FeeM domain-containing protein n=1 Tax=Mesorhizobium sp. KR9-304 TaxID=3156614 RepID=UPI0032B4A738